MKSIRPGPQHSHIVRGELRDHDAEGGKEEMGDRSERGGREAPVERYEAPSIEDLGEIDELTLYRGRQHKVPNGADNPQSMWYHVIGSSPIRHKH